MSDADVIRAAIEAIADDAHSPQHIRAALDARSRHHRQRRLLLRVAGATASAGVAGAGGFAAYRLARPDVTAFPEIAGGPGGGWLQAAPRWRPGWLPDGFGLTELGVVVDGSGAIVVGRTWRRPQREGEPRSPSVSVTTGWLEPYSAKSTEAGADGVDINGTPGRLTTYTPDGGASVVWQPAGEPRLEVGVSFNDVERARSVALRVARSLRRDPGTFTIGPRPGWLPEPLADQPWLYTLLAADGTWLQSVLIRTTSAEVSLNAGPAVESPLGTEDTEEFMIRQARARRSTRGTELFAEQLDDRNVFAYASVEGIDLTRIVEDFDLGPAPDMTWYGSR
ncbi:hypothetical protein GCM10010399_52800 [Dactylosporangium fulvum]|uniref:hypothetical protein n=1 Tax=Dactylosporangium fulvum TaxID=53359 RepID=UPI0031E2AD86